MRSSYVETVIPPSVTMLVLTLAATGCAAKQPVEGANNPLHAVDMEPERYGDDDIKQITSVAL